MNTFTQAPSELRLRMIEGMRMRKLELHTREGYIHAARKLPIWPRQPDAVTLIELENGAIKLISYTAVEADLRAALALCFAPLLTIFRHLFQRGIGCDLSHR